MLPFDLIPSGLREVYDTIVTLAVAGISGAYFRAVVSPEPNWRRRILQGIAGAASSICLGGAVAYFILTVFSEMGVFAYLASGFIMGSVGS